MEYRLTAEYEGETETETVYGEAENMPRQIWPLMVGSEDPQEIADADAAMSAIGVVLNRATEDPVWAKGRIELRRLDGTLVKVMEAK